MQSNETAREEQARSQVVKSAPKLPDALKQKTQTEAQEAQKVELVRNVMESRLDRLKNYKLTGDSRLWDQKEYTQRVKEIGKFIQTLSAGSTVESIKAASFELSPKDGSLITDDILPAFNGSVENIQKVALRLIRADNGSDQIEFIAAKNLGDLIDKGVKKLESDTKAQNEIKRRASRDFGEMVRQGAFDDIDRAQRDAAEAGLEAMYQMRYIAKEYIDEKSGIPVPENLRHIWENYRDSLDIKDDLFTVSDTGKTQIASFLAYDLAPMIISGGIAGAVGKGLIGLARMPAIAKYANSGTKMAKIATVSGRTGVAVAEAAVFDASFEGIRNQRLFTDKPNWQQDLVKNAFGFGFSRYLAGAKSFSGITLDPLSNQLVKQGLIVPAIISGVGVGQKLLANDPDAYHGAWEEFILGAVMTGAFHMTGRVLEKKFPAKEMGIQKIEVTPDGSQAVVTTPDGQKFTTRMTEKLKAAVAKLKRPQNNEPQSANLNPKDTAHGAPLEPAGPNVAQAENGGKLPEVKIPVEKNKTTETSETTTDKTKLELAPGIKEKGPYRNESRLAKLHEGKRDTQTLLQKLQAEYSRLRDAFHIPSDKQLKFDYFHTSETNGNKINSEMRVVKVGEDMFVQVKNNGVWEVATEQNIIPKSPNARAEYDAYVQHQKDLLRSGVHNQIPDDVISMIDSGDLFKKQLNFDFYNNRSNAKMRVVELPNNEYLVQVKNNGVWEVATEQNIIPKSPNARAEYDAYVQHQKDLLRSGVHNQFMKPEELNQQLSDATNRLQRIDSLIQKESARPDRPSSEKTTPITEPPLTDLFPGDKLSFRDDIANMMKMDDATFQNRFTESQYRIDANGARPFEKEMYQGVAKVRKMSDEYVSANANTIIVEHRSFLSGQHPNRGPSNLSQAEKAQIIAENAALRLRIKDIIGKKDPILAAIAEDPVKLAQVVKERKNTPLWPLLLLLIPLIYALSKCSDGTSEDKKKIADICEQCKTGPKSDLDYHRKSEVNSQLVMTDTVRLSISNRWMATKTWKDAMKFFDANRTAVNKNSPQTNNVATALDAVKKSPTPENVQALQRCIGMVADDKKIGQDGILGPITTGELVKAITSYIAPSGAGKVPKQDPSQLPTDADDVSPLGGAGVII